MIPPRKINQICFTVTVFLFLSSLLSCTPETCREGENLTLFYYPAESLKQPKIYKFLSPGDPSLPHNYWWIKSFKKNSRKYLVSLNFDQRFIPLQIGVEEITDAGAFMDKLALVGTDSLSGELYLTPAKIIYDNLFPFCAEKQGGVFLYTIEWQDVQREEYSYTLVRNRRYLQDTVILQDNMPVPAKVFSVNDEIEIFEEGQGYVQPRIRGFEIYAKGKGLVQYIKAFDSSLILNYELDTIFDADSFIRENEINFAAWEKVLDSFFTQQ